MNAGWQGYRDRQIRRRLPRGGPGAWAAGDAAGQQYVRTYAPGKPHGGGQVLPWLVARWMRAFLCRREIHAGGDGVGGLPPGPHRSLHSTPLTGVRKYSYLLVPSTA